MLPSFPRFAPSLLLVVASILLGLAAGPEAASALSFREGVDGYTGVQDTFLQNNFGTNGATNTTLLVRTGDEMFSTRNALIRFDDIVGTDPGQIAPSTPITSATLTLTTEDEIGDTVNLHRMLLDWDETTLTDDTAGQAPFNSTDWVQNDGLEAAVAVSVSVSPTMTQTAYVLDVTADVQAWIDGTANFGWVLLGTSETPVRFHSSDALLEANRPLLEINGVPEPSTVGLVLAGLALGAAVRRR